MFQSEEHLSPVRQSTASKGKSLRSTPKSWPLRASLSFPPVSTFPNHIEFVPSVGSSVKAAHLLSQLPSCAPTAPDPHEDNRSGSSNPNSPLQDASVDARFWSCHRCGGGGEDEEEDEESLAQLLLLCCD